MNPDGTKPIRLTDDKAQNSYAAWSPDSRRIAFVSLKSALLLFISGYKMSVMNADGTNATYLSENATQPTWSPDGQHIAFTSFDDNKSDIYVINIDGTNLIRLTDNQGANRAPAWSPK
jgi:Tol biopolymer transport system component